MLSIIITLVSLTLEWLGPERAVLFAQDEWSRNNQRLTLDTIRTFIKG